jgi:hypothetical protein
MKIARKIGSHVGEERPCLGVHALHALHGEQGAAAQHDSKANANATHAGADGRAPPHERRITREAWRLFVRCCSVLPPAATPNNRPLCGRADLWY